MTAQATFSLDAIDAALAAAGPGLDPDEQRLAAASAASIASSEKVACAVMGGCPLASEDVQAAVRTVRTPARLLG